MTTAERRWTGQVLFVLGWLLAGLLVLVLVTAPLLESRDDAPPTTWGRVVAVFARDAVVRRTCLASALGLVVSACVFFRPVRHASVEATPPPARPRSSGMAGA
ncbi:MAG: hypothetical protein U0840_29740 [Gemmataceae bacterium]